MLHDSIYRESINTSTKANINILATRQSEAKNKTYQKLVKLYHDASEQKWIKAKYHGTKVEVQKPLSYVEGN